jgi:hypothetical protein
VSAHWYIEDAAVTVSTAPRTIHDFGGFPRVLRSQLIGRTVKVLGEPLDEANVTLCGSLRVMTSLEFFQHDSA